MIVVQDVEAALCILSIAAFIAYVVSLFETPTGRRPRTPTYDRFGDRIASTENPGYRAVEEETH